MNEEYKTPEEPRQPMSALACIAVAFDIVAHYPSLIVLPILLDLLLWLGPRLSIAPIVRELQTFVGENLTTLAPTMEAREGYLMLEQGLERIATEYNLFSVVSPAPLLGVPVLMPARMTAARPLMNERATIVIASLPAAMGWVGLVLVVGMVFSTLYLTWIGQRVLRDTDSPLAGVDSLWHVGLRLGGALVWMVTVAGLLSAALMFFVQIIGMVSVALGSIALLTLLSLVFFLALHLLFVVPSIVQMRRGIWQAMRESIILTRGDLFNTSLLILLALLISQGFMVVWQLPDPSSWAMLVSIIGHAVISTALMVALFVFYQERLNFLKIVQKIYAMKDVPVQPLAGE